MCVELIKENIDLLWVWMRVLCLYLYDLCNVVKISIYSNNNQINYGIHWNNCKLYKLSPVDWREIFMKQSVGECICNQSELYELYKYNVVLINLTHCFHFLKSFKIFYICIFDMFQQIIYNNWCNIMKRNNLMFIFCFIRNQNTVWKLHPILVK